MKTFRIPVKIGLAIAFLMLSSPNVLAHTELVSTSPAANTSVNVHPQNISLTFSEAPILAGSYIQVEQASSDFVYKPQPQLNGNKLVIPWPAQITPGQVSVKWRAVADDGHVSNGSFAFTFQQASDTEGSVALEVDNTARDIAVRGAGIALVILLIGIVATTRRKK